MTFWETASDDLAKIFDEVKSSDVGTLVSPDSVETNLDVIYNDIATAFDPETGTVIMGRTITAALRISQLNEMPKGVSSELIKPWVLVYLGEQYKVMRTSPDYGAGLVVCWLEKYTP